VDGGRNEARAGARDGGSSRRGRPERSSRARPRRRRASRGGRRRSTCSTRPGRWDRMRRGAGSGGRCRRRWKGRGPCSNAGRTDRRLRRWRCSRGPGLHGGPPCAAPRRAPVGRRGAARGLRVRQETSRNAILPVAAGRLPMVTDRPGPDRASGGACRLHRSSARRATEGGAPQRPAPTVVIYATASPAGAASGSPGCACSGSGDWLLAPVRAALELHLHDEVHHLAGEAVLHIAEPAAPQVARGTAPAAVLADDERAGIVAEPADEVSRRSS
jgi:hypothetical protein